jgi:hypothetical protein
MAEATATKGNGFSNFKWSNILQWIMPIGLIIGLVINWNTMTIKLQQHEIDMARIQLLLEAEIVRGDAAIALDVADQEKQQIYADSLLSARQDTLRTRMDTADSLVQALRNLQETEDTATQVVLGAIRVQLTYLQQEVEKLNK